MVSIADPKWGAGVKIAFRFFFIFLTLQILTESFLGNLVGFSIDIWGLGAKIFTPPCLWLNRHLFHFYYTPASWTIFSESLHTIRDIVYLGLTIVGCMIWTLADGKRPDYNRLHYWFSRVLVTGLSCILFAYGIIKIFPIQMAMPSVTTLGRQVGTMSPFELLWATMGYGTPYEIFSGIVEVSGAILVLFRRTRLAGLLIILSALLNIILLNYTYRIGVLVLSVYILLITLFLLAPNAPSLTRLLFFGKATRPYREPYVPERNGKTIGFRILMALLVVTSFFLNTRWAYQRYTKRAALTRSRQYSLIREHIVGNDTLRLIEKDSLRWRLWSESTVEGKRMLSIVSMDPGVFKTYTLGRDSVGHILTLFPAGKMDTARFHYTEVNEKDWRLDGMIGKSRVQLWLQRIDPDTAYRLLQTKRRIVVFDDEGE
jgi:hypothetical protein